MTILLVDDRPENLYALQDMLEEEGRTFLTAGSGNEALKILLRNPDIGLIMLDVQMPDMDGFEVARILKANAKTRDISIIFVTAISKEEQYVLKGFEEGAVDYLQKPLDIRVTRAKVKVFEHLHAYQQKLKLALGREEVIRKQLERFVHTVSHDLKSPLSSVVSLLNITLYDLESITPEELKENLQVAEQSSLQLTHMVDSILDYSRKSHEEQQQETVDVAALVQEVFRLLPGNASATLESAGTLPVLQTSKAKLRQVFQNLISNALKYGDKAETRITIGCTAGDSFYTFSVRDNGPGIAAEDQAHIFGLFRKGSRESTGDSSTGVGLNVMKVLVEEQGGRIWVSSEPGQGSTFFFEWKRS